MAKPSLRPPFAGPPLIRTLARLGQAPVAGDAPVLPAVLGNWVDWNRAVALARALDGALPALQEESALPSLQALMEEHARARQAHADAIDALSDALLGPLDAAELQRRHATLQRAQLTSTGRLRGRLRDLLAHRGEQGARLAEIDAVMEQALAPREYRLLNTLSTELGEQALAALLPAASAADNTASTPPPVWPPAFRDAVRDLLQAEVELRYHPIEGLLAALHQH